MTTLQDRLRDPRYLGQEGMRNEAADRIDALQARIAVLETALQICSAGFTTQPGTVISVAVEVQNEFQRRMEIAGMALLAHPDAAARLPGPLADCGAAAGGAQ